jgi:hypothetical protein
MFTDLWRMQCLCMHGEAVGTLWLFLYSTIRDYWYRRLQPGLSSLLYLGPRLLLFWIPWSGASVYIMEDKPNVGDNFPKKSGWKNVNKTFKNLASLFSSMVVLAALYLLAQLAWTN